MLAGETYWVIAVARDGRAAVVASCVLVHTRLVFGNVRVARVASAVANGFPIVRGVCVETMVQVSSLASSERISINVLVDIRLIDDVQVGEVLPHNPSIVLRTRTDIL